MAIGDDATPLDAYFDATFPDGKRKKQSSSTAKIAAAFVAIAMIPAVNATLASPISLGNGRVEFGQGQAAAAVCDPSVNIAVDNSYDASLGYFKVNSLTLSDLDTTADGCLAKTLTVRAFTSGNSEIDLNGNASGNALTYVVPSDVGITASTTLAVSSDVNSATIAKVTVETN